MRRLTWAALAVALLAPASAMAGSLSLGVRAKPVRGYKETGNIAGRGAVLEVRVQVTRQAPGAPAPLTNLTLDLPRGMRWDPRAFQKCPPQGAMQPLRSSLFPWCPLRWRTKQNTYARMTVAFGSELVSEQLIVEPFYDTDDGQSFNIEGHEPVPIYFFANGTFHPRAAGGESFELTFPVVETAFGRPPAAVTELAFDIGSGRTSPTTKRTYFSLRMPRGCPGRKLAFDAVATFSGAERLTARHQAPCPRLPGR